MTIRPTLLAMAALASASALHAALPVISIDRATQKRLGIVTAPIPAAMIRTQATSFGHVLDPTPLMTLDSDLEAAMASAAASSAEARRSRALAAADATIARKAAEAATAQARGDAARLLLLRRRLVLEWGARIAALPDRHRAALIADLAAGRSALLRVDTPPGSWPRSATTAIVDAGDQGTATARFLGDARAADPRQAMAGRLAIVSGRLAGSLAIGLTLPVRMATGAGSAGVLVPASAVLRHGGQDWVYVLRSDGRFERHPLGGTVPQGAGLLVRSGVHAGDIVATQGAAKLYTAEQASSAAGE